MTDVTQTNVAEADLLKNLGPLAPLVGIWGGDKGVDIAPSKDGSKETRFRQEDSVARRELGWHWGCGNTCPDCPR